jgi:hypothetical protein
MDATSDNTAAWGINTSLEACIQRFEDYLIPAGGQYGVK